MNKNIFIIIILIISSLVFVLVYNNQKESDYKNSLYNIEGENILLKDGYSEKEIAPGSASKIITKYFGNEVRGDFNGDNLEDVAFLLTKDNGGSGIFYYLAAALKINKGYIITNTIFLGDRIAPQTTEFKDGVIIVNYADRAINQAMTESPSIGVSKRFKVQNNELLLIQ